MICKKEWQQFFSSITGYLILGLFLLITGLLLFVFPDSSLLNFGYANLNGFFSLMPWLLLFLIPAITMRSIAEERRIGSFEILKTLPLTEYNIVLGKFLGVLFIVFAALLPTIIYAFSMQALSITGGIDIGSTIGSYISLFFLAALYAAIGIFTSSLAKNMIAAFAIGAFLVFVLFVGFDAISSLALFSNSTNYYIQLLGIKVHTANMSRGVIDSEDLVYFVATTFFFLYCTKIKIAQQNFQQA